MSLEFIRALQAAFEEVEKQQRESNKNGNQQQRADVEQLRQGSVAQVGHLEDGREDRLVGKTPENTPRDESENARN